MESESMAPQEEENEHEADLARENDVLDRSQGALTSTDLEEVDRFVDMAFRLVWSGAPWREAWAKANRVLAGIDASPDLPLLEWVDALPKPSPSPLFVTSEGLAAANAPAAGAKAASSEVAPAPRPSAAAPPMQPLRVVAEGSGENEKRIDVERPREPQSPHRDRRGRVPRVRRGDPLEELPREPDAGVERPPPAATERVARCDRSGAREDEVMPTNFDKILAALANGHLTPKQIEEKTGLSDVSVSPSLAILKDRGLITNDGRGLPYRLTSTKKTIADVAKKHAPVSAADVPSAAPIEPEIAEAISKLETRVVYHEGQVIKLRNAIEALRLAGAA